MEHILAELVQTAGRNWLIVPSIGGFVLAGLVALYLANAANEATEDEPVMKNIAVGLLVAAVACGLFTVANWQDAQDACAAMTPIERLDHHCDLVATPPWE